MTAPQCWQCCSSTLAAAAVASICAGRLDARMFLSSAAEADVFATWLRRHARLLRSLALLPHYAPEGDEALHAHVDAALAGGLRHAEQLAAPGSLSRLWSFSCTGIHCPGAPLLAAALAPASGALTRLELSAFCAPWFRDLFGGALAQLTGLRRLELQTGGGCQCDDAGALAGLQRLTRMQCLRVTFLPKDLPRLPESLEHLVLAVEQQSGQAADLGHLRRLTELYLWNHARKDTVLPPSLAKLAVTGLESLQPLLRLTALRQLQSNAAPAQVVELARCLPLLDDVRFWQSGGGEADALTTVQACESVPVRDFGVLWLGPQPAPVLQHISRLTALAALKLRCSHVEMEWPRVAAVLRALPQLRELDLSHVWIVSELFYPEDALLMEVVVQMPELRSFNCWDFVSTEAYEKLSAAMQLTKLVFTCQGQASDYSLAFMLRQLTRLERLVLPPVIEEWDECEPDECGFLEALCRLRRLRALYVPSHWEDDHDRLRRLWVSLPQLVYLGWIYSELWN